MVNQQIDVVDVGRNMPAATNDFAVNRYPLPGVPLPNLPDDIVNLQYLQSRISGNFWLNLINASAGDERFFILNSANTYGNSVSNTVKIPFPFIIVQIGCRVKTNGKPNTTSIKLTRPGPVTISELQVPGGATGYFETSIESVEQPINSFVEWTIDFGGAGNFDAYITAWYK